MDRYTDQEGLKWFYIVEGIELGIMNARGVITSTGIIPKKYLNKSIMDQHGRMYNIDRGFELYPSSRWVISKLTNTKLGRLYYDNV
jgi:hypothetical protein